MDPTQTAAEYRIWGADEAVYGPVELPTLIEWIKDERVTAETWLYDQEHLAWGKAADLPSLRMFFVSPTAASAGNRTGLKLGSMRRVKILAEMTDDQLERFAQFMDLTPVKQWDEVVHQGDHGTAMYLVLEGELRVRLMIGGKETILATLSAGEFFGEMALFDESPRSADVVANNNSTLLKVSADAITRLRKEAPDVAASYLFAVGKTLVARIRADNKRYRESVQVARSAK